MSLTLLEIVALTGIFTLAGTVKGAIGLGLPTVSMGLLSLMMPPGQAAALLLRPSLITNLWQLLCGPRLGALWRRLWPMPLFTRRRPLWSPMSRPVRKLIRKPSVVCWSNK